MKNDDELKVTIAGDFNADPQWLVADAESANVSCRRETPVDDFIALEDRAGRDVGMEMTHDSEDGQFQTLVNDATRRLFIRNDED